MFGSLAAWAATIRENFDRWFWVGDETGAEQELRPDLVNCTQIYKDSVGSERSWPDYQLRPNYCITLALAADLTSPPRAWAALQTVVRRLLGPLGVATLDSQDWAYRGQYNNSDQGSDPSTAHGANYHQGPEWVWPVGFLLRALETAASRLGEAELQSCHATLRTTLSLLHAHLAASDWLGLPELTNAGGAECRQATSAELSRQRIVHFEAVKRTSRGNQYFHLQAVQLPKSASFPCNLTSNR